MEAFLGELTIKTRKKKGHSSNQRKKIFQAEITDQHV